MLQKLLPKYRAMGAMASILGSEDFNCFHAVLNPCQRPRAVPAVFTPCSLSYLVGFLV